MGKCCISYDQCKRAQAWQEPHRLSVRSWKGKKKDMLFIFILIIFVLAQYNPAKVWAALPTVHLQDFDKKVKTPFSSLTRKKADSCHCFVLVPLFLWQMYCALKQLQYYSNGEMLPQYYFYSGIQQLFPHLIYDFTLYIFMCLLLWGKRSWKEGKMNSFFV